MRYLINLSLPQLERALAYLANPEELSPPPDLPELPQAQWQLLQALLEKLELERQHNPVH